MLLSGGLNLAFVTEAALIALREGLEALLITGILLGLVTRLGRPDARKHVWAGFVAAVAASIVAGVLIHRYLLRAFEANGYGAAFELGAALLAVATLTYMVFWMWSHTTQVLKQAKDKVRDALTAGSLVTIVFITFISTVREGLETVLFYSALSSQASAVDILWSGGIGFLVSAALVYAILRGARRIGLKRFFTATGVFLIIVAAMLLTHVAGAMTELGWIEPQRAIWDTSALVADDSAAGRLLHATLGYTATPTLLQAGLYFGYLFLAGGAYLWINGFFHRATTQGRELVTGRLATALLAVLLVTSLVGVAGANPTDTLVTGHSHTAEAHGDDRDHGLAFPDLPEDARIGVMLRNHGEPVHYNETTYQSFADFTRRLLIMFGFEALLDVDQGTVLLDRDDPFADEPSLDPDLMDAWTHDHAGPAVWVGSQFSEIQGTELVEGNYIAPGGPGLGEPDVLEAAGLSAYRAWVQMEHYSPMHYDKAAILGTVEQELVEAYGDQVVVVEGYSIQPRVSPDESFEDAARALAEAEVDLIVDAYTSAMHSDVMNHCMMKPRFMEALDSAGVQAPVVHAGPSGLDPAFAEGVADHVAERLAAYPADARISVHLTHHGMTPGSQSYCEDREDPYNTQTGILFEQAQAAVANRSIDRDVQVLQVYGQGAGEEDDGVLSPTEALEQARDWGATHVLDIPYELPGNGFDNLVIHRLNYELDPEQAPHYGPGYETELTRYGMDVRITSSAFAVEERARAQLHVILDALQEGLDHLDDTEGAA